MRGIVLKSTRTVHSHGKGIRHSARPVLHAKKIALARALVNIKVLIPQHAGPDTDALDSVG
jgi:hypothetical protein